MSLHYTLTAPSPAASAHRPPASFLATLPRPPLIPFQIHIPVFAHLISWPARPQQRRHVAAVPAANGGEFNTGVFPGGTRRASVRLPGLGLRVRTDEVLGDGDALKGVLDSAVAAGVNVVVLEDGKEDGLRLYDAARVVMTVLRGRADLLVVERVDIAAAAGANGVVLSDRGLPSVVARRMMQNAMPEAVVLPLVARRVTTAQSAENATITEGADLLMLQLEDSSEAERMVASTCERVKIPVFLESSNQEDSFVKLLKAGANGLVLNSLPKSTEVSSYVAALVSTINSAIQLRSGKAAKLNGDRGATAFQVRGRDSLEQQAKQIIEEERIVLSSAVDVIRAASPEMQEVVLLIEAIKQLDDLFLLVVVGEFNSGKSSVINALLGNEFLKQGILPTTNEITLLKFSDESFEERIERHPDGHLMRYLSAELLKQMNLVDTPGTNVILQRQQRLTEEFVPRADLVMFVIGVERPLTESEVSFLRYIRRWEKKIIFSLNKSDLLSEGSEVEEVTKFVKDNVRQLLNIEDVVVYPVSARNALRAKRKVTLSNGKVDKESLKQDPLWKRSGFDDLEHYVFSFLGGSSDSGAERVRLKLDTPLGIAVKLLSACQKQLQTDAAKVEADLKTLEKMQEQLLRYKESMENNVDVQIQRVTASIDGATARALKYIDKSLQYSNVDTVSKYLLPRDRGAAVTADSTYFDSEIIGSALSDVKKAIEDHWLWLASNNQRQLENYQQVGRNRWPDINAGNHEQQMVELSKSSLEVLDGFDVKAANVLLEQELREVVFSTYGSLGVAGASASFLTSILPTTLEDLIALGVCSAGGLASIFKLPSLRAEVKRKIKQVADSLAQKIGDAMIHELRESGQAIEDTMERLTSPYRVAVEAEFERVSSLRSKLLIIDDQLQFLRQKVQNLGSM